MAAMVDRALALAQELIRCRSVSPDDAGCIELLRHALEPHGFACTPLTFDDAQGRPVRSLFARFGTSAPHFCFSGHIDVVPAGDATAWRFPPFSATVADGFLFGRGAADMKSSVACFVIAVLDYLAQTPDFGGSISLLITADEELSGAYGAKPCMAWLAEHGQLPDACLVGEPTSAKVFGDTIKIGRRGSIYFDLSVQGIQGHSAYPHLADNPALRLVRILEELTRAPLDDGTPEFAASNLQITSMDMGNPVRNLIPAKASASFSIRFNPLHTPASLTAWVEAIVQRHAPEQAMLVAAVSGEPFITRQADYIASVQQAVARVTGVTADLNTGGGTSDARYIGKYVPVVEFGPLGTTIHQIDERIALTELDQLTACYRAVLDAYFAT